MQVGLPPSAAIFPSPSSTPWRLRGWGALSKSSEEGEVLGCSVPPACLPPQSQNLLSDSLCTDSSCTQGTGGWWSGHQGREGVLMVASQALVSSLEEFGGDTDKTPYNYESLKHYPRRSSRGRGCKEPGPGNLHLWGVPPMLCPLVRSPRWEVKGLEIL